MRPRLRPFEVSWTRATFEAIWGPATRASEDSELDRECVHPAQFFDELLVESPLEQSLGLRVALWVVALSPLFTLAKFSTIASLSRTDRERVVEKLLASPIYLVRQLAISMKALATLLFATFERAQRSRLAAAAKGIQHGVLALGPGPSSLLPAASIVRRSSEHAQPARGEGAHDHAAE